MDGDISMKEVLAAIKQANAYITPGPNSFFASYYKKQAPALRNGVLLNAHSNRAHIYLIPKQDRPIDLIGF